MSPTTLQGSKVSTFESLDIVNPSTSLCSTECHLDTQEASLQPLLPETADSMCTGTRHVYLCPCVHAQCPRRDASPKRQCHIVHVELDLTSWDYCD